MKQHTLHLLFLLMMISTAAFSQTSILSTQSTDVNEDRYKDIKGNPYLFDDWVKANIYDKDDNLIKDIALNYNAYDHGIEVTKNGRLTILDELFYPKIIIKKHKLKKSVDGPIVLVRYGDKNAKPGTYVQEISAADQMTLYKKYKTTMNETTVNLPGKIEVKKKFYSTSDYIIYKNETYTQVKNKLDEFIKFLGHEKELKSFAKKNKIKLKTDEEAKVLFEYALSLE